MIITTDELNKYFGKEVTPRQMKDQIMAMLDNWKEKQLPALDKPQRDRLSLGTLCPKALILDKEATN